MKKDNLKDLFINELKDMYSAEQQIVQGLPDVIKAAQLPELKEALKNHLEETEHQVERLEEIFSTLGIEGGGETCEAMEGLIQECVEAINEHPKSPVRDAAIISKCQRIEHYEISAYGTLRTLAKELKMNEAVDLIKESLDEEANADKKLTKIAEGGFLTAGVNAKAAGE